MMILGDFPAENKCAKRRITCTLRMEFYPR